MLLDDIKAKLISAGVANTTTWRCFVSYAPDSQDQLISLHDTGGYPQETLAGDVNHETFQVRVRAGARDYATARSKWQEVFNALNDASPPTVGIYLIQAEAAGPLTSYDDAERPNLTVNYRVKRAAP
jgi:hypothetical protein